MLVAGVVVPISLSLLFTQSANGLPLGADKLLDKALPVVTQLLPTVNNTQPSQSNGNPQNASTTPAATQSQGAANQSSAATTATQTNSATLPDPEVTPLEPLATIDSGEILRPLVPLGQLASARGESTPKVMLASAASSPVLPIQASEDGWRLFGMAWYWWLLIGGALGYGARYFIVLRRQKYIAYISK
jgi:hypothetical protein